MYRIGEFSTLSKVTIKALRYYEKEGLLIPSFTDNETGYRFYETSQLVDIAKIVSMRQIGLTIDNIKSVLNGERQLDELLFSRKNEISSELSVLDAELSRIKFIMEGKEMKYNAVIKELPECTVYYKEGIIKDFSEITKFILDSGNECLKANPKMKCAQPDYCFVNYLDGEYKEKDISIRYAQAVTKAGEETEEIKFKTLKGVSAVSIYHKGSYSNLGEAYAFVYKWIEDNNFVPTEPARECYIDGMWNKEDENDWLTEIQVPIKKA